MDHMETRECSPKNGESDETGRCKLNEVKLGPQSDFWVVSCIPKLRFEPPPYDLSYYSYP